MILLNFGMHRAGPHLRRWCCFEGGIAFESHAAFGTISGLVGDHALTHRAKVFGIITRFDIGVMITGVLAGRVVR